MKIIFLQDFQGRETRNIFYKKDEVADLEIEVAELLVNEKRAAFVAEKVEIQEPVIEIVEEVKPKRGKK